MRWQTCIPVLALVAIQACAPPARVDAPAGPFRIPDSLRVQVREGGRTTIRRVPLEEYVHAAILSEFAPASGDTSTIGRMFELQAVISRTYAVAHIGRHAREGFDLCATTHCQVYEPGRAQTSRWAPTARAAAAQTAGTVLWFDRAPATALYHADCGGRTSDAASVWGGSPLPYLRTVIDDGVAAGAHAAWRYEIGSADLRRALNAHEPTAIGSRLAGIDVAARDAAGRAERIRLRGDTERVVRGEDFRTALTRAFGPRSIRSTRFEAEQRGDSWIFQGQGFGHGVGLCQAGAYARVGSGTAPAAVLQHYYPGTRLLVSGQRR